MNENNEFEVGGYKFQLTKIDAIKQFHIVRRLGPILGDLIPMAQKLKGIDTNNMTEEQKLDQFAKLLTPFITGLSKLSDADADLVLFGLCSSAQIHQKQFNNWARVATGSVLSFQLPLPVLLQVAGRAFAYNLADFFAMSPQTSHGGK